MSINFAAVGDVHGHQDHVVDQLRQWELNTGKKIDFILQVGDFECHRDLDDLATMACPQKYRALGDFHAYFADQKVMPWPLYFIGGNHECYGWLDQYPKGFKLIDNLHYLGRAQKTVVQDLRISGLSGIFHEKYYDEHRPPLSALSDTSNKLYTYFNEQDVLALCKQGACDILLLHDWPAGLVSDQATRALGFRGAGDNIGNIPARLIVDTLKPKLVLCGHMHASFRTVINHSNGASTQVACLASVMQPSRAGFAFFSWDGTHLKEEGG
jgi:lariat debranching enzyme